LLELARSIEDATIAQATREARRPTRAGFTWARPLWPLAWQGRRP
jgi:hypothetical protein